jgi:D-inositol-3-phosphate glycosyltransferase
MVRAVSHLVDDPSPGGVTRMLDYICTCPEIAANARHEFIHVRRGSFTAPKISADVIVSNLVVSWANLPLFMSLRASFPNIPLIHVEHSYCEAFVALNVPNRARFDTLLRIVYSLFDRVVAVSERQAKWLLRKRLVRPEKLRVVAPLADLAPYLAIPSRAASNRYIVGAIGRMEPQKGFDILVEAFKQPHLSNFALHLFGEGSQREALRTSAGGQSNIVFEGYASAPATAMAACDIIAMPSRWEPYGMVAMEAMAANRPLICARVDGLLDHIEAGAIDVGENSPTGWSSRLNQIVDTDLSLVRTRGRQIALGAKARFAKGWNALVAEEIYGPSRNGRAA